MTPGYKTPLTGLLIKGTFRSWCRKGVVDWERERPNKAFIYFDQNTQTNQSFPIGRISGKNSVRRDD